LGVYNIINNIKGIVMEKQNINYEDLPEESQQAIDNSTNVSYEFIEYELFPQLENFEHHNEEDDYVVGCASFILFTKIVTKMNDLGYSIEQLHEIVDQYYDMGSNDTIH
jgi:hypothetical protein